MRTLRSSAALRLGAAVLLVWVSACAGNTAPRGFLPTTDEAIHHPYGGWISVVLHGSKERIHGELLALDRDYLWIQTSAGLETPRYADVEKATLTFYAHDRWIPAWSFLGSLSTASHGFILIISFPIWVFTGTVFSVAHSRTPQIKYPDKPLSQFRPFARFPQGMPPEYARADTTDRAG